MACLIFIQCCTAPRPSEAPYLNVHEGNTRSALLGWRIAPRICHIGPIVTTPPVCPPHLKLPPVYARTKYGMWKTNASTCSMQILHAAGCLNAVSIVAQFLVHFLHRGWRRIDIAPRPTSAMDIYPSGMTILLAWNEYCSLVYCRDLRSFDVMRYARTIVAQHQPRPIRTRHPPASSNSCNVIAAVYFTFFLFASRTL